MGKCICLTKIIALESEIVAAYLTYSQNKTKQIIAYIFGGMVLLLNWLISCCLKDFSNRCGRLLVPTHEFVLD